MGMMPFKRVDVRTVRKAIKQMKEGDRTIVIKCMMSSKSMIAIRESIERGYFNVISENEERIWLERR